MKKGIGLLLICILASGILTACGEELKVDENTVYVQKKGKITGATVESFDKDYYNEEELKTYVDERVEGYNKDHDDKSVKVDSFQVEEGSAKLNILYAGYEDYAAFNGVEMFAGTIPQALAEGYQFEGEFTAVEDGKANDKEKVTGEKIMALEDYKVVILSEKINVKVDGAIAYVSSKYTDMVSEDTVAIKLPKDAQDGEELALTYVIYQ